MRSVITYFTGGTKYSVPADLGLSYLLLQLRFMLFGYVVSYYFDTPFSAVTAALCIVLADLRFFIDFTDYIDSQLEPEDDDEDVK